ncbi:hypothetical protein PUMCH_002829 [Australozyma saopauloensis]|uniref:TPR-like protein n=1 Tax=Australozyma saopauloensis TaxID=291208 RepID=A0AAX4HCA6_9ASCO|nr:hypothetical protein PUMCH_002829 [[Candida] saopauloensis]
MSDSTQNQPITDQQRIVLAQLALLLPLEKVQPQNEFQTSPQLKHILGGTLGTSVESVFPSLLVGAKEIAAKYPETSLEDVTRELAHSIGNSLSRFETQLVAIALLQFFIQCNFCGPQRPLTAVEFPFGEEHAAKLQKDAIELLSLEGQSSYDFVVEPFFLVLSLALFEHLMGCSHLLVTNSAVKTDEVLAEGTRFVEELASSSSSAEFASLSWWRTRALQAHLSILLEPVDVLATLSSVLLQQPVLNALLPDSASCDNAHMLRQNLLMVFFLENARNAIHAQTEHLAEPFLAAATKISQLDFVLTGAKAKRTKFQTFHASSLVLLAKSQMEEFCPEHTADVAPQTYELNSDLLLEKPQYESLDFDDNNNSEDPAQEAKKIKLDGDLSYLVLEKEKLLPICMQSTDIPIALRSLNPNEQPPLVNLDVLQLLLRLVIIKQTSPSGNAMVEEELLAVVSRIIYSSQGNNNWAIFGRALWERSLLETSKARTVERGILQMTSLVEEAGIHIKTRTIPQLQETTCEDVHSRLRYMHQLPLMGHWKMDAKLAEKYMALGVIKSAIDIYERLNMVTEAALCYAAIDEEQQAERMLVARLESHPKDARAISILGDIRQDPQLWETAWEVGHYAKAKASLSRYYYQPPADSGLKRDLQLALQHMHDCLSASPLNYENWFFYGCCGLESGNQEIAAEAFTRCVSLDDTNSHAWSNLASALLKLDKTKQAFNALKRALQQGEGAKRSWRIFENYLLVAAKLGEWNDVLHASRELLKIRKEEGGEVVLDIPVLEKLVQLLVEEPYPADQRRSHFQLSCIDLICNMVPSVVNHNARVWRLVGRVEIWQGKPWAALDCAEKAYRATSLRPDLDTSEEAWNEAVEACSDLVSAYESLGELPGKHGAGDVVCKDWKYKARSSVRSLMSKGKQMWEDSTGWDTLLELKEQIASL